MGRILDSVGQVMPPAGASTDAKLAHLTKVVHVLWKEVERLERTVHVTSAGLTIKTGVSEVRVLNDGSIGLNGMNIQLVAAGKIQLKTSGQSQVFS